MLIINFSMPFGLSSTPGHCSRRCPTCSASVMVDFLHSLSPTCGWPCYPWSLEQRAMPYSWGMLPTSFKVWILREDNIGKRYLRLCGCGFFQIAFCIACMLVCLTFLIESLCFLMLMLFVLRTLFLLCLCIVLFLVAVH